MSDPGTSEPRYRIGEITGPTLRTIQHHELGLAVPNGPRMTAGRALPGRHAEGQGDAR